jgi:hypothetical protein
MPAAIGRAMILSVAISPSRGYAQGAVHALAHVAGYSVFNDASAAEE